jgi:hypothetical protein
MAIYLSLGLHKGRLGEAFSPQRDHPALQNMKIQYFLLFLWVIFALLDPDPATQINADPCGSGSGSATLLERPPNHQSMALWVSGDGIWGGWR